MRQPPDHIGIATLGQPFAALDTALAAAIRGCAYDKLISYLIDINNLGIEMMDNTVAKMQARPKHRKHLPPPDPALINYGEGHAPPPTKETPVAQAAPDPHARPVRQRRPRHPVPVPKAH